MDVRNFCLATLLAACCVQGADPPGATVGPFYTVEGIVSSASGKQPVAAGTLVTIYGSHLSFITAAVAPENIHANNLPMELGGTRVSLNGIPAGLYYVSPTQINFLIGTTTTATELELQVTNEGRAGPTLRIPLAAAAPALFLSDPDFVVGTRADASVVTNDSPVHPGDVVVLYATGLGRTVPGFGERELPDRAAMLVRTSEFRVELNGTRLDPAAVFYAGVTPGFAGLYQINLRLPEATPENPEIRIGFEGQMSTTGIKLPLTAPAAERENGQPGLQPVRLN